MSAQWWAGFLLGIVTGWGSLCLFVWSLFWWEDLKLRKRVSDSAGGKP